MTEYIAIFSTPPPELCHARQISITVDAVEEQVHHCKIIQSFTAENNEDALAEVFTIAEREKWKLLDLIAIAHRVKIVDAPSLVCC